MKDAAECITADISKPGELGPPGRGPGRGRERVPVLPHARDRHGRAHAGAHYLDLTEDVQSTREVMALAQGAKSAMIPQCGLAPASSRSWPTTSRSASTSCATCTCGSARCPRSRTTRSSTTSPGAPTASSTSTATRASRSATASRWTRCRSRKSSSFALDGVDYEAFNTSGGLGTLSETLKGRVENLNYKTVRYPGHRDIVKTLVRDLRLDRRRDLLKDVLEAAIPMTKQDVVLVYRLGTGRARGPPAAGGLRQEDLRPADRRAPLLGDPGDHRRRHLRHGGPAGRGKLPQTGFVRQEQAPLTEFLANRFGTYYA
jgi:hypothetical protein